MMRSPILAVVLMLFFNGGCYRDCVLYQGRAGKGDPRQFTIDTSRLPPGTITTRHDTHDFGINPSSLLVIRPNYPVRIIIVPATQP